MRVLIIEDADERIKWFRETYVNHVLDVTKDVIQAIAWLQQYAYEYIFLDHDLSDQHYTILATGINGYDNKTGYEVACYIASQYNTFRNIPIIIHSLNPYGIGRMESVLKQAGLVTYVIPFTILQQGVVRLEGD